jgi:holo-[acyl-carrier protein] synthase
MEAIAVGIDIVEIARIRAVHERYPRRFLERVYTPVERQRANQLRDPTSYLAGRFAVKEAVLKVLGTGLRGGISWQDIHVLREPSGAPRVLLGGKALERAEEIGLGHVLVSISHGREHAVAQALGLRGGSDNINFYKQTT